MHEIVNIFEGKSKQIHLEAGIYIIIDWLFKVNNHDGKFIRALMELLKMINNNTFNTEITQALF